MVCAVNSTASAETTSVSYYSVCTGSYRDIGEPFFIGSSSSRSELEKVVSKLGCEVRLLIGMIVIMWYLLKQCQKTGYHPKWPKTCCRSLGTLRQHPTYLFILVHNFIIQSCILFLSIMVHAFRVHVLLVKTQHGHVISPISYFLGSTSCLILVSPSHDVKQIFVMWIWSHGPNPIMEADWGQFW